MRLTEVFSLKTRRKQKRSFSVERGKPFPLGATVYEHGVNFAVFSRHATAVTLVLLKPQENQPFLELTLNNKTNKTGSIWHICVHNLPPEMLYGYRIEGPRRRERGHTYQQQRILLDPYCKALSGGKIWGESEQNRYSSIVNDEFVWHGDSMLRKPIKDLIIYELHVRGFSKHPSASSKYPGTFRGIIEKIPYLRKLGVNAVELLPIFEFSENDNSYCNPATNESLKNFWGYNTIGFFAPKTAYAADKRNNRHLREFKELVQAFHQAGIEVILDVVFNHTGEGNENGPCWHFRGLDNSIYYMLDNDGNYINFSGCGNTVNCNHPVVRDFILDCLHYWVVEMHVDGFRFDLAAILSRDENGRVLKKPPVIERIARDPILSDCKLIAEPWDAAGLYQVGCFPSFGHWSEWNGKFRDDVREFVRGDNDKTYALAMRLLGSPDLYMHSGRQPQHSINFITCHDGFTLYDLVAYNHKHNDMNGEGNRDGENNNGSWNCGHEGPANDPQIRTLRYRQMKNFLAILFLSQGVPMLLAGDEFARTQYGNNNAYCQDNEISWLDWNFLHKHQEIFRFTCEMIAFRKRHPILCQEQFLQTPDLQGSGVQWHGIKLHKPDWGHYSHSLAFVLKGSPGKGNDIYVAINAYWEPLEFAIPAIASQYGQWNVIIDTSKPCPEDIIPETQRRHLPASKYLLLPRSVVVLVAT